MGHYAVKHHNIYDSSVPCRSTPFTHYTDYVSYSADISVRPDNDWNHCS